MLQEFSEFNEMIYNQANQMPESMMPDFRKYPK